MTLLEIKEFIIKMKILGVCDYTKSISSTESPMLGFIEYGVEVYNHNNEYETYI